MSGEPENTPSRSREEAPPARPGALLVAQPVDGKDEKPRTPELVALAMRSAVIAGVITAFVALFLLFWYAADVLLIAFGGLLFAIFLRTGRELVQRLTGWSEKVALGVFGGGLLLLIAGLGWLAAPTIIEQAVQLSRDLPKSVERVKERISQSETGRWVLERLPDASKMAPPSEALLARTASLMTALLGAFGAFGVAGMSLLIGLLLALQPPLYLDGLLKLVPIGKRPRAVEVMREVGQTLKWWLLAKMASMTVIGLLTWLGLWFLDIELAFTLAVLTGLLTFIPNFGPIVSTIPPALLGLSHGPGVALAVVALYIIVQFIESNLVTPFIEYQTVSLPPALTVTAQLAAGSLLGVLGITFATPLLAAAIVMVRMLYVEDVLGDELGVPDTPPLANILAPEGKSDDK